jgi:serine/threonine-protein kinase
MENLGKYEIIEKIGEGGFGSVFKARDPHLKRIVALKTCTHDDPDLQKRFLREGEIVASLHHPNITLIHDLGFEGGTPFLVQEFLTGEDLSAVIGRREKLDDETRFNWLIGVARGLEYAHAQGIIHRDIKPANIRILDNGTPKIMDFGIAKLTQDENRLTRTGSAMGTIAYMSPEQLDGSQVDHRSDIFAFGVLAYELFAYSRPFDGETTSRIVYQILHEDPRRIESMAPPFGPGLNQILRRCLAKKPLMRFQSCGEAATAFERLRLGLAPFDEKTSAGWATADAPPANLNRTELLDAGAMADLASRDSGAQRLGTGTYATAPPPTSGAYSAVPPTGTAQTAASARPKRGLMLGGAAAVAVAAVGGWLLFGRGEEPAAPAPVQTAAASPSANPAPVPTQPETTPPVTTEAAPPAVAPAVEPAPAPEATEPAPVETRPAAKPAEPASTESTPAARTRAEGSERTAQQARSGAETAGARELAPALYGEGERLWSEGRAAVAAKRFETAHQAFLGASEAFHRASSTSILAAKAAEASKVAAAPAPSAPPPAAPELKPAAPEPAPAPAAPDPQAEIQRVLDGYVAAYQSLDAGAVVAAVPSLKARQGELERAFAQYRSLKVALSGCRIDVAGERATASCEKRQSFEMKVGQGRTIDGRATFRLSRTGGRWSIDSIDG